MFIIYTQKDLRRNIEICTYSKNIDFCTFLDNFAEIKKRYNILWQKYNTVLKSPEDGTLIIR